MIRLLLATVAISTACVAAAQNALPIIKWRTLAEGTSSQIKEYERHFMYTSGDMQTVCKKAFGQFSPPRPVTVDWNTQMVIAVFLGTRNTGGYGVYVETITRSTAAAAVVSVVEKTPPKSGATTQAVTSPWVMVVIDRPGVVDWQFSKRNIVDLPPIQIIRNGCGRRECTCRSRANDLVGVVETLGFREFSQGWNSTVQSAKFQVMKFENEFRGYWLQSFGGVDIPSSGVDWKKRQLIALNLGRIDIPTRITVERIHRLWNGSIEVQYSLLEGDRRGATMSPYVIVDMPLRVEAINFKRVAGMCPCTCDKCQD